MRNLVYDLNEMKAIHQLKNVIGKVALHDFILEKYCQILVFSPMKEKKFEILLKLSKSQKVGMLNSHILGVASKLNVSQRLISSVRDLLTNHTKYKGFVDAEKNKTKKEYDTVSDILSSFDNEDKYWTNVFERNQIDLSNQLNLLIDIVCDEINHRKDPKYLRKIKIENIDNHK